MQGQRGFGCDKQHKSTELDLTAFIQMQAVH